MALRAVAPPLPNPPPEPLLRGSYFLGADQTTGLSAGSAIRFVDYRGNLPLIPSYRVLLPAGKTFRLTAAVLTQFSASNGSCNIRWYDETVGSYLDGVNGNTLSTANPANQGMQPTTYCELVTSTDTVVYLRIVNQLSLSTIVRGNSYGEIIEIR